MWLPLSLSIFLYFLMTFLNIVLIPLSYYLFFRLYIDRVFSCGVAIRGKSIKGFVWNFVCSHEEVLNSVSCRYLANTSFSCWLIFLFCSLNCRTICSYVGSISSYVDKKCLVLVLEFICLYVYVRLTKGLHLSVHKHKYFLTLPTLKVPANLLVCNFFVEVGTSLGELAATIWIVKYPNCFGKCKLKVHA